MTIKLEVNGVQYDNFESVSCELRLDALSSTFSFAATADQGTPLPFKGGEPCSVIVDEEKVLTGSIEIVAVDYSASDHTIFIQGRDKTGDLLDSTLSPIDIRAPITLKQLIEIVLKQIGLDIQVIDEVSPKAFTSEELSDGDDGDELDPFNEAEDLAAIEAGDSAFSFLEQYSRKRQVLLTSDADGNVVIATNSGESAPGALQNIIGSDDNNILAASFSFDTTGRFNVYKFVSQLNPNTLNFAGEVSLGTIVNQTGEAFDPNIRIGRQLVLVSEVPYSSAQNKTRARWEADIRRARGLIYAVTVDGYRVDPSDPDSDLWRTNKLYQITDDFLGKQEPMLCNSVTYTLDLVSGQQTALGFVDEKTYTLDLTKPKTSETALDFVL